MLVPIQRLALLVVAFTIPFPIRVNSVAIILATVLCVGPALQIKTLKALVLSPLFILIMAHALILVVGLTYSPDINQGFADIERFALAVALLILTFSMRQSEVTIVQLVSMLALGCATIIVYGFFAVIFQDESARRNALTLGHVYFTDKIGIHPAYLTLYLSFIFFFIIEILKQGTGSSQKYRIYFISALAAILVLVLFLRSQMGMIVFMLMSVMYVFTHFKQRAAMVVFFLTSVALIVYLVDDQRVHTFFDSYGKNVSSALDHRKQIWEGAMTGIGEAPVFGAGTGGEQTALNNAFAEIGFNEGIEKSYNAHNQYLSFMLRNGAVELICFLGLLFYCFRIALPRPNRSFLIFLMIFALTITTESCLNVQKGIVFFYLFIGAWSYMKEEQPKTN